MPADEEAPARVLTATIHLIRHGDHDEVGRVLSGRSVIPLNARGRSQAARLGEWLRDKGVGAIHSSPRPRAIETAEAIATATGLPVEMVPALDEVDFGIWTGRSFAELDGDPDWDAWNARRGVTRVPGGETMMEAVLRAAAHIEAVPAGRTIACVSHCDVIRGLVLHYLGVGVDRILSIDCEPASVSTLTIGPEGVRLVRLNLGV
ncbi:histidine phosphatase family protein [Sphingomonas sp. ID0503]|uniref:histidine phosphatase family protein n=1 Tax=Sphingomonas sp. ID0503 TaxID=3399691 RepID=UPI003AFB4E5D